MDFPSHPWCEALTAIMILTRRKSDCVILLFFKRFLLYICHRVTRRTLARHPNQSRRSYFLLAPLIPGLSRRPSAVLQTGSRFCFASAGDKWRVAAAALSTRWKPHVLPNAGLAALLSFRAVESQACIQTLDVWEKKDGFIQAQMKEDKQADPSAAGRLSEFISHFIPKAFVQNSTLKILGETAPTRFRDSLIRPAVQARR